MTLFMPGQKRRMQSAWDVYRENIRKPNDLTGEDGRKYTATKLKYGYGRYGIVVVT